MTHKTYRILGVSHHSQDHLQRARQYYEASLQIAKKIGDERGIILAINNLGGLSEREGNYLEAKAAYTEAVERSIKFSTDHRLLINTLNSLSTLCIADGEYEQALVYLREGESFALLHGHQLDRIRTLWLLATIQKIKGDEAGAHKYAQESLKIARDAGYLRSVSFLLGELGKWFLEEGNYSEATSHLNEAIALGRQLGISGRHFRILHYWGELYLAKEQLHEAIKIWIEVLEKAKELIYIIAANYGLACVAEVQNDADLVGHYTSNWYALLTEMNSYQKKTLKQWLSNIPIHV
jgi:tetratricopeptide (TPR) repeat protein